MQNEMNHIYRYRSIDKLFEYKELENLEIYFAKPDELNDQMEDYMNIVWQGDEIAFRGLFKHYLYTLSSVYYDTNFRNRKQKIDIDYFPVFLASDINNKPEMQSTFKSIYHEFFNPIDIANIPSEMALSNKKYSIDEILFILKHLHPYAYLVIDSIFKKLDYGIDVFKDKEHKEIYEELKYSKQYSSLIKAINSGEQAEKVDLICKFERERKLTKAILNNMHKDKDTYNISILNFDFPEIYLKNIKKILYNNFCVACFSNSYQNEPMWSNYADCENGICLKYKIKTENNKKYLSLNSACNDNPNEEIYKKFNNLEILNVNYSNEYPEINFFASLGGLPKKIIEEFWLCNYDRTRFSTCLDYYKNHNEWYFNYHKKAKEYICTKSKNWEYEQEQRIILRNLLYPAYENKEYRIANYDIRDLDSIISGRKVSTEDKRKVIEIINKHYSKSGANVKFYDLYYSTITNKLELKPCSEYIYL